MISSAAEYRFVDFAGGTLPTGRFSGGIMPLRPQTTQTPGVLTKDALAAEDVAFLAECVRDKVYAFENSGTPPDPNGGGYGATTSGAINPRHKVKLEKRISSSQMTDTIRKFIVDCMTGGKINTKEDVGFLRYPFTETSNIISLDSDDYAAGTFPIPDLSANSTTCLAVESAFYGTWTPTTTVADFAVGAPVAAAPVAALFDDAKNLVVPVMGKRNSGDFLPYASFYADVVYGSLPQYEPLSADLLYKSITDASSGPYAYYTQVRNGLVESEITVARVSDEFLDNVELWCIYLAFNHLYGDWAKPRGPYGTTSNRWLYKSGLIKLDDYLTKSHIQGVNGAPGEFVWRFVRPNAAKTLTQKVATDCGFTLLSPSEIGEGQWGRQYFYPFGDSILLFVGTPNGRTRWWSD